MFRTYLQESAVSEHGNGNAPDMSKGRRVNFREPQGEPGFFGPGSIAWRVHANPISMAIGGVAAVLLELAEPRVRSGVWNHSIFQTDPLKRILRTREATMITTYASRPAAQARVDMVTRMHARVSGVTPEGQSYTALDPELLTWVHITAFWGFLNAYKRYVAPDMSLADQDRYYMESKPLARAFGAVDPPGLVSEVDTWFERMRPKLVPHPIIDEFLDIVSATSPMGLVGRVLQPMLVRAAIDLLPKDLAAKLQLPEQRVRLAAARPVLRALALTARRKPGEIPLQACERVGCDWREALT